MNILRYKTMFVLVVLCCSIPAYAGGMELRSLEDTTIQDPDYYYNLARSAQEAGDLEMAKQAYMRMLELSNLPNNLKLRLALIYTRSGYYMQAQRLYQAILKGNPSPAIHKQVTNALLSMEMLLLLQKDNKQIVPEPTLVDIKDAFEEALEEETGQKLDISALDEAIILAKNGQYQEAKEIYEQTLAADPAPDIRQNVETALTALDSMIAIENAPKITEMDKRLLAASPSHDAIRQRDELSQSIAVLTEKIKADPNNLDHYFNLAIVATAKGEIDIAIQAYEYMLLNHPELDRVKLDLALLYARKDRNEEARQLFEEVMAHNPPPEVQNKVVSLLEQINKKLVRHQFEKAVTVGYIYDTNGNSASSSDTISVFDSIIDLPDGSQSQEDHQFSVAANINYTYRLDHDAVHPNVETKWYSNGVVYRSEQLDLDELDLFLVGVKTGPIFDFKEQNVRVGLAGGYNYIELGGEEYLHVGSGELNVRYQPIDRLSLASALTFEQRRFVNSSTSTVLADKTGEAHQAKIGVVYALSNKNLVSGVGTYRKENTRQEYYDNEQLGFQGSYTHIFDGPIYTTLSAGIKESRYDDADPLISVKTRADNEMTAGASISKELYNDVTGTLQYQYKNVDSNIVNYDYDNHRISTSVGVKF